MRSQKSGVRSQNQSPDREGGVNSPDSLIDLLRGVVADLGLELSSQQINELATHFSLLLRWNEKINLTSIRKPEEIVARHFEESLFLATLVPPPVGLFVDIGSGAGFPGLPLKIVWPSSEAVLLEPNNRKATFLKEVIRSCGLNGIEVRAERLEEAAKGTLLGRAALITMRAVRPSAAILQALAKLLAPAGWLALFLGASDAAAVSAHRAASRSAEPSFHWQAPVPIPHSQQRVILIGQIAA